MTAGFGAAARPAGCRGDGWARDAVPPGLTGYDGYPHGVVGYVSAVLAILSSGGMGGLRASGSSPTSSRRRVPAATRGRLVSACVAIGVLTACGPGAEELPAHGRVYDATVTGDGTQVAFSIDLCARPLLELIVEETSEEVRVHAVTERGPDPDDCAMQQHVTLDEPLGNRAVIDVGAGERISQIYDGTDGGEPDQEREVEASVDDAVNPVGSGGIPPAEQWPVTAVYLACGTCESVFDIGGIVFEGSCLPVREELVGAVIADEVFEVAELVGEPTHLRVAWRDTDMPCDGPQDVWRLATAGTTSDAVRCRVLQEPSEFC